MSIHAKQHLWRCHGNMPRVLFRAMHNDGYIMRAWKRHCHDAVNEHHGSVVFC